MKKRRFTEIHIMGVLRKAEGGVPIAELCREHGMRSATIRQDRINSGKLPKLKASRLKVRGARYPTHPDQ